MSQHLPIPIKSLELAEWIPTGQKWPTQLHLIIRVDTGESEELQDLAYVMRFMGTGTLDQLISQLIRHRENIWGSG